MHLKLNGMFRKMAEKSLKHTVIDPSGADVATLAKMRKSVIAGWLKSTPNGAQMLADARAILAEVRAKK